ncbi:MAG: alpha-N-acetylglucosaminidase C-terminal domain-containing protein [Phycisphaerae bacterium]|nr:alpha-N-acetylglucosaminidase C-terminal domain-containing protein [Phycisphaerae bacterium]
MMALSELSRLFVLVVTLSSGTSTHAGDREGAPKPVVVALEADDSLFPVRHARAELAKYIRQMTGGKVFLSKRQDPPERSGRTVISLSLGGVAEILRSQPGAKDARRLRDGFVIRSADDRHLNIAAIEPIGLLYGVYHYLESCCGVGFFWDGDHVSRRSDIPISGLDIVQLPRWPVRHFGLSSCWGLAKWHHQFRTTDQRKQIVDWMAKRKINRSSHSFAPTVAASGTSAARVYGISDAVPDNFTFAGWPGCLDWPAKVRTQIIKEQFDYARERGISWIYYLAYGNVPHQFRQTHPEYRYVDQLGYSATVLFPDDPACAQWSKAFYKDVIETYGTDHIYQDCPFVESAGANDVEKSFQLKLTAARQMCEVFRELDKDAVWESDSWDFGALPHVWTPDRIKRYFDSLPKEMMLIYDTAGLGNPFYKKTDYFEGTRWALGILHSFQGDDHLHGDLSLAIRSIQALSKDPKAERLEGIYHVPESTGHNVLFFDLTCRLAWQPDGLKLEDYLRDYARRRYGTQCLGQMLQAVQAVVRAVHGGGIGGGAMPIYQKIGCHYGPADWWPIVDDRRVESDSRDALKRASSTLRRAVLLSMECSRVLDDNSLYVNDMVDWARTYLAHLLNYAVLNAYDGFKRGDARQVKQSAGLARECLAKTEAILSTRPDFSLQAQIDRAMKIPGANSFLPWYMKQHCVNDLYSANEVYEQLHWYYGPRAEVYLSELEARAAKGVKMITWKDIEARCGTIHARWLEGDIDVPDEHRYKGTTLEAVAEAVQSRFGHTSESEIDATGKKRE